MLCHPEIEDVAAYVKARTSNIKAATDHTATVTAHTVAGTIKKHPNTNARQSQGIRKRMQSVSTRQNEQLPVSRFQRDAMQTGQCKRKYEVN